MGQSLRKVLVIASSFVLATNKRGLHILSESFLGVDLKPKSAPIPPPAGVIELDVMQQGPPFEVETGLTFKTIRTGFELSEEFQGKVLTSTTSLHESRLIEFFKLIVSSIKSEKVNALGVNCKLLIDSEDSYPAFFSNSLGSLTQLSGRYQLEYDERATLFLNVNQVEYGKLDVDDDEREGIIIDCNLHIERINEDLVELATTMSEGLAAQLLKLLSH